MDNVRVESLSPQVVVAEKLRILNPNEFDLSKMRIKQYFLMTDYSLWEVILNGASPTPTRVVDGVVQAVAPINTEQKLAKKNELKAIGTLLIALPDKHQLKFNIHKDAKSLIEAIEKRNKADLEDQSLDVLFNNLKIYEVEVNSSSSTRHNTQNINFVSSQNTNNTNESVSDIPSVSAASTKAPASILPNVDNLSDVFIYSFFSNESVPTSPVHDRYKIGEGYHVVPSPYTWTFMQPKPNLVFHDAPTITKIVLNVFNVELVPLSLPRTCLSQIGLLPLSLKIGFLTQKMNLKGTKGNWVLKSKCTVLDHVSRLTSASMNLKQFDYTDALGVSKSDNETEYKNHDLNKFCGMKGIKREFSVAITPQHNGVAKRKNMTLIDAARTMLADSLLPILFWVKAVNTACYVQNRVLVTKPHNKTPYELLLGRTPSIGFMRPFGCPLNILNTLDLIGKFNGKADKGFLVRYSISSKAFRVFNSRTRIVQVTLHINFLKNQPNVAGSRPKWLFDIDTLTHFMNYQSVITENQPNPSAGIKENLDADVDAAFDVKKNESKVHVSSSSSDKTKKHDDKAKRDAKGKNPIDLSTRVRNLSDEFEDFSSNSTNRVNAASAPVTTVGPNPTNNTNSFNAAIPFDNVVNMPALEDIIYFDDEGDVGVEADFSNLETSITVSPILITRVYKDHPVTQIIGDLTSAPQTRSMARMNPREYTKHSKILVGLLPYKRNYFNSNAKGLGISRFTYGLCVLYVLYGISNGSQKCFLYETIEEEVYVCQPRGFEDPNYPNKVYKVVKAFYGLHKALRAWYLKGKPHLGLWYLKASPFNLVEYSDSDYAGASLNRKSTTGGCQFLGCRLISWQCKKQTVVATSSIEVEYVASIVYLLNAHTIQYTLMVNPPIYVLCIKQFWASVSVKKSNYVVKLQALIDRKKVGITEDTIRQDLRLNDANGVECLPNEEIFAELARMGYEKPPPKLTFYKVFFSAQWKFLIHTIILCMSMKRTAWNEFSSLMRYF
uniref:Integrase catalytic domain-containing protein n=1 Tax=Tanacetum cinerariifolium TaxID=118510 RepID=A0A6L2JJN4_TANCI|nr:hypothetical protein [Tanacetum cinerariifolium]